MSYRDLEEVLVFRRVVTLTPRYQEPPVNAFISRDDGVIPCIKRLGAMLSNC